MQLSRPMVGREAELEYLMGLLARAFDSHGGLVMVSGEAGSGKTTLCEAFERLATQSGCSILVGRCIPGNQAPYMPFLEAWFGRSPNPFITTESELEGVDLLLSVLDSVDRLSSGRPLVIRLEDLHWTDSSTINLLHFLARNVRTRRVMLIATYRPEELHDSPSGDWHPLKRALRAMMREGVCQALDLGPLELDDNKRIVPLLLGGPTDEILQELIARESKGNPLFAVEMINLMVMSEQVVFDGREWRLRLKHTVTTPSTIRDVILLRIEHLSREARQVLESASVAGERFDLDLIRLGSKVVEGDVIEVLESLESEDHLVRKDGDRYQFTHDKVRQVVYEGISKARKKVLHLHVGTVLEKRLPNEELLGLLSWHFKEAGDDRRCVLYSLESGRLCHRRKAVREAKVYLQLVVDRAGEDHRFAAARLEALETLGDLGSDASSVEEWFSFYERFLDSCPDSRAKARVLAKASECWDQMGLGDSRRSSQMLDEAERLADGDPRILAEVAYQRASLANNMNGEDALRLVALARHRFEELDDQIGTMRCRELEMLILRQAHQMRKARELAEELLGLARGLGDVERLVNIEMYATYICSYVGETHSAKRYGSEVIELASKLGLMLPYMVALTYRAFALDLEGDVEGARVDASKALEAAHESKSIFYITMCEADLGLYEAELGMMEEAETRATVVVQASAEFEPYIRSLFDLDIIILRAELLARRGCFNQSDELYHQAMKQALSIGLLLEALKVCTRHAMSLARRGANVEARRRFDEAMDLAVQIGCEPRVQTMAGRVGISV